MEEEKKKKTRVGLWIGLAVGISSFVLGGLFGGCTARMGGEKPVNALSNEINEYEKVYELDQPKRAIEIEEVTGHPFPKLHIPKNLESDITITEPLKVTSPYNETEGGYWATATLQYISPEATGAYRFYGNVQTNDSTNYSIAGSGSTIWKIEVSIVAEGDIYFTPNEYNIFSNLTHYYQVPIQVTDYNNPESSDTLLVYPNECVAVDYLNLSVVQLYTAIEPYSVVYPTRTRWFQAGAQSGASASYTFISSSVGKLFEGRDYVSFPTKLTNNLASSIQVSYSWTNALVANTRQKWIFAVEVETGESIWLQDNIFVSVESRQAFSIRRENIPQGEPIRAELTPNGTYQSPIWQAQSGSYPNYVVWSGVEGATEGLQDAMNIITMGFTAVGSILELKVFGMTFGMLLAIPLIVLIIIAIMRLLAK